MKRNNWILIILTIAYAILWIGGVASYNFFPQPPPEASWAAPIFLFIAAIIIILSSDWKQCIALCIAGLIGFASEILGVFTSFPYGNYSYTSTIKPLLFGVPLVMIAAWLILIAYAQQLVLQLKLRGLTAITIGALIMVWVDLLIDPVAIGPMKFWVWNDSGWYYGIPFQNFLGWFLVSAVIFALISRTYQKNIWHKYVGGSVILFFVLIAFSEKLLLAGIIGSLLLILQIVNELFFNINKFSSKKVK